MADIVVNVTHGHNDITIINPGAAVAVPISSDWSTCGAAHATCNHNSMVSDNLLQYGTTTKALANKVVQTGDIRINNIHAHSCWFAGYGTNVTVYLKTWKTCPASHTKCQKNAETTYPCWKTIGANIDHAIGITQQIGDIVLNWYHYHTWDRLGNSLTVEQMPGTCPTVHVMCQENLPTVALIRYVSSPQNTSSSYEA